MRIYVPTPHIRERTEAQATQGSVTFSTEGLAQQTSGYDIIEFDASDLLRSDTIFLQGRRIGWTSELPTADSASHESST